MEVAKVITLAAGIALLLSVTSAQANDIADCEYGIGGGIKVPRHEGCTCVTDGPGFRNGYLVDCKGRKLCKLREGMGEGGIIGKDTSQRRSKEPCASLLPLWETERCAYDSWSRQSWNWIAIKSDRTDRSRVKVTYRKCKIRGSDCAPLFGETGQASEITLVPRETVYLLCSNRGRVEILLCEVQK